jgi:protein phosphatase
MEKIAIISDIHGNITALEAVLADIEKRGIKRIFCLGDYVIKCVHSDLVIDKLREVCEVMLLGNSDYAICRPEAKNKKFWSRELIGEKRADYIYHLPVFHEFYMSGHLIRLFHASPYGLDNIYNPMFSNKNTQYSGTELNGPEELFKNTEFIGKTSDDPEPDIVGYGHIHTPCLVRYKNKTLFNPGSVGISVEMLNSDINDKSNKFSTLASYIIIEGDYDSKELDSISFNLVRVPYDIQKEIDAIKASDLPNKNMVIRSLKGALPTIFDFN